MADAADKAARKAAKEAEKQRKYNEKVAKLQQKLAAAENKRVQREHVAELKQKIRAQKPPSKVAPALKKAAASAGTAIAKGAKRSANNLGKKPMPQALRNSGGDDWFTYKSNPSKNSYSRGSSNNDLLFGSSDERKKRSDDAFKKWF